jgi:hypothetical protein
VKIISLPHSAGIEAQVNGAIVQDDAATERENNVLLHNHSGLTTLQYLRFRILHRQFQRGYFPFFPSAVRTVRQAYHRLDILRGWRREK